MPESDAKKTYAELAQENALFLGEIAVTRQASRITAQLVVRQFVRLEEILRRLEQTLAAEQQLVAAANQARTQVAKLQAEHDLLETQVAYATTDAAVIQWAHENGKMVKGDEVLVVPLVPTAGPTPLPPTVPLPTVPPTWVLWQNLFFGEVALAVPSRLQGEVIQFFLRRLSAHFHRCGVEQWQLVGLITRRSLVRIQPPLLFEKRRKTRRFLLVLAFRAHNLGIVGSNLTPAT